MSAGEPVVTVDGHPEPRRRAGARTLVPGPRFTVDIDTGTAAGRTAVDGAG